MPKNKTAIYLIISLAIVLIGFAIFTSKQNRPPTVSIDNTAPSSKEDSFSFDNAIGKQAPDFNLKDISGTNVRLSDYRGKTVVLFFSAGSMCYPACWDQIAEFGKDKRFNTDNVKVFSIVVDPKSIWKEILQKTTEFSNAKILFDTTKSVSKKYGVLSVRSSMHPGRYPGHTYFIIDKNGIVRYAFDDPSMAVRNDLIFSKLSKIIK